jgi:amino acid transporter, AAT family
LPVRTPGFPFVQIAGLLLLCAVLVTMGLDKETWRISWIVGIPWLVLLSAVYFVLKSRRARAAVLAAATIDAG